MKRDYIYIIIIIAIAIWGFVSSDSVSKEKEENKKLEIELSVLKDNIQDMTVELEISRDYEEVARIQDSLRLNTIDSLLLISKKRHDPIKDPVPDANPRNDSIRKWAGEWTTK